MKKEKRWQLVLILAVICLTVYNILPTLFYYSNPLQAPISSNGAEAIEKDIAKRVNASQKQSIEWLKSYCATLHLSPKKISIDPDSADLIHVEFTSTKEADVFRKFIPRAGQLISNTAAQIMLAESASSPGNKIVSVRNRVFSLIDSHKLDSYFQFSTKYNEDGKISPLYQALVEDRVAQLGVAMGGTSENGGELQNICKTNAQDTDLLNSMCQNILSFTDTFGEKSSITQRFFSSFSQADYSNKGELIARFIALLERALDTVKVERIALSKEAETLSQQKQFLPIEKKSRLEELQSLEALYQKTTSLVKKYAKAFESGKDPFTVSTVKAKLASAGPITKSSLSEISLDSHNVFVESITVDWKNDKLILNLYADVADFIKKQEKGFSKLKAEPYLYNEIAYLSRICEEKISPQKDLFEISLSDLPQSEGFIALKLSKFAEDKANSLKKILQENWQPKHPDLNAKTFPVWDYATYSKLPAHKKKLGLVIYSPSQENQLPQNPFKMSSIYVIAKGLDKIMQRIQNSSDSSFSQLLMEDFANLRKILNENGMYGYPGATFTKSNEFSNDFIFELENYYQPILKASRENFKVQGTKRFAVLELSTNEQRLLTQNKIDSQYHEELLKWRDEYNASQSNLKGLHPYDVAKPTQSPFISNLLLSAKKYLRGDERKIIRWGLDLSGGKTVLLELRDSDNKVVTADADLKQAVNELYNRVNKMGVSEVSIRQENHLISMDFPGSQSLSATDLVKASSMFFHVVNEKFSYSNPSLKNALARFLQDVWNEAVVTNRKDVENINLIACHHLYGDNLDSSKALPRSDAAKLLYQNGLRLANPLESKTSSHFDLNLSKLALLRGDDVSEWGGHLNPLMVVFQNYVLEGASLDNVQASFDPSKGNYLSFSVKSSMEKNNEKINPQADFYKWTSHFNKEHVIGSELENYSPGRGWRMAVILNGTVISAPTLDAALKDQAMISGSFTQREVTQLEADLKAGSLTFTPKILSEKNVSPELGSKEKHLGILATLIALLLVVGTMIGYYRFAGFVASVAVIFNLLIMWAVLQNLQATLTLASIAGIILTVGMAVDANVLVFERMREELSQNGGNVKGAVEAGYSKAFSAILDSNVTTIIAGLILLNFDSGPIKGFAVTLIVGIASSMFTALFMTRYFFTQWAKKESSQIKMANIFHAPKIDFLKWKNAAYITSAAIILLGVFSATSLKEKLLGMDFTGGVAFNIEMPLQAENNYRNSVEKALLSKGVSSNDFEIRELSPNNLVKVFLSHRFHPTTDSTKETDIQNPKIGFVINALEEAGYQFTPATLKQLETEWSEVSGQMSDSMRQNALLGLGLALLCILIYITIRFEFKYAVSATLCTLHDVVVTLGFMCLLSYLGLPLQLDLHTITALMTIIGYSLNDTIIVFDRIREDLKPGHSLSLSEVINKSLNVTLSRTIMTSLTTFLVLIPLIALGGSTVFGFSLVMALGVVIGTLSSLFIASPILLALHHREESASKKSLQLQIQE